MDSDYIDWRAAVTPYKATCRHAAYIMREKQGVTRRSQIRERFDNTEGINGIGRKYTEAIKYGLGLSNEEWADRFPGIEAD